MSQVLVWTVNLSEVCHCFTVLAWVDKALGSWDLLSNQRVWLSHQFSSHLSLCTEQSWPLFFSCKLKRQEETFVISFTKMPPNMSLIKILRTLLEVSHSGQLLRCFDLLCSYLPHSFWIYSRTCDWPASNEFWGITVGISLPCWP